MFRGKSFRVIQGLLGFALVAAIGAVAVAAPAKVAKPAKVTQQKKTVQPTGRVAQGALVSYEREVKPLLVKRCYACHGNGTRLGNFQLDSRAGLLTGGNTHPVVVPGKGAQSYFIKLVAGQIPGKIMPMRGPRLTPAEVKLLTRWIDQGASFGSDKTAAAWKAPMALRRPALPAVAGVTHPIDRLLHPYLAKHRPRPSGRTVSTASRSSVPSPVVDDRTYARRVYLDLIGLLPTPKELRAFAADRAPDKRLRLARKLLADNQNYAEHWLTFWNDALRNDYAGTGYIDGGRLQITGWLQDALYTNKPFDRFVAELVNPTPESLGFVKGIVWRGVVNASQTPEMQAAQNISQVFMGVNLKCASCHDSFISNWKLADAYGMASIYAEKPLEMVRCDKPLGQVAPVKFLYPELGQIDGSLPKPQRLARLAEVLTSRSNGRLARTMVNRLWAKLMGRGLVEPADEMDNRPWSPELLDWLAADFVDNGWDVKHVLETIVTSRAYQMPSVGLPSENAPEYVFRGPVVKRMSAEQFVDGVSQLTGVWSKPAVQFRVERGALALPRDGRAAIKFQSEVMRSGSAEIDVDVTGAAYLFLIATDGGNGGNSDWANWVEPRFVGPDGERRLTDLKWRSATTGYGEVRRNRSVVDKPLRLGDRTFENGIGTHADSVIAFAVPPGTTRFRALAGPDTGALEQPNAATSVRFYVVTGDRSTVETRAALSLSDPLTRALGRPNREQVVTQRSPVATTLQALELTNGGTLAAILAQGADRSVSGDPEIGEAATKQPGELVDHLYEYALSRPPTASERAMALELLGSRLSREGVEDLLWSLVMLPEYQLY